MGERSFKELLEHHIRESGYTNYEFARLTGINRVNLQRYLAGTRVPNPQTVEIFIKELRLGSLEQMELAESYKRAFDGDAIYFMRKAVREFLENIRNVCGAEDKIAQAEEREEQREMEIIHGEIAVERYLWAAIGENMKKNENSEVYLYIPAERFTSARILPGCFFWTLERKENCHTGNPKVFQMVPLTKRPDRMSHQYHNLRVLQNLIPVYCQAGARYEVRYFYHDLPDAGMNEGLLYPFYVILEDRVVLLAVDMEQAISISQRDFVEMYRKKFLQKYRRGGYYASGKIYQQFYWNAAMAF